MEEVLAQRLFQTSTKDGQPLVVGSESVIASHFQLTSIISGRLGQGHAHLLATPVLGNQGDIAWQTSLTGPVQLASQLDADTRSAIEKRAQRMLGDIAGLGAQLAVESAMSGSVGRMLEYATQRAPGDWLCSVGGKPVLAMWGHASSPGSATPAVSNAAPAQRADEAPPAAPTAMAAGEAGGAVTSASRSRWPWFALGAAALFLISRLPPTADATDLSAQLAQVDAANKALDEELRKRKDTRQNYQCLPDEPVVPPAPAASMSLPPEPASAPAREPPPAPAEPPAPAPLTKEQKIAQARNQCPGQRPPELAPQVAIVFDSSRSMDFIVDVSEQEMVNAISLETAPATEFGRQLARGMFARLHQEPRRITMAKRATLAAIERVPSDVNIGLVVLDECEVGAKSLGYFPPGRRDALRAQIQRIEPDAATPLAEGIRVAGGMLDGVNRESLMLVVSDGAESCKGDPCAAAAALARAKPHLRINVVDITGAGAGACLAKATNGKVFKAMNMDEVVAGLNRAAKDVMGPESCRK